MADWYLTGTCTAKRHGLKFRLHQRIVFEDDRKRHDCYTPTIFTSKQDAERFLGEFVQSIKAALQRGTQDISEHPWTGIFIEKVKQCTRKPEYVMEWITDYEGNSGTGAKRTASKQTKQT